MLGILKMAHDVMRVAETVTTVGTFAAAAKAVETGNPADMADQLGQAGGEEVMARAVAALQGQKTDAA